MKKIMTLLVLMTAAVAAVFAKPSQYGKCTAFVTNSTEKVICIVVEDNKGIADFESGYINIQPGETVWVTTDKQMSICFGMNEKGVAEDGTWPHFEFFTGTVDLKAPGSANMRGLPGRNF